MNAHATTEPELVFNVVFTPGTFRCLRPFTHSLLANSTSRLRLVCNGCSDDDMSLMRDFRDYDARVDVHVASHGEMLPHGEVLERLYAHTDDGGFFCFIDSDVIAKRPFVDDFLRLLPAYDAITTGDVAWTDDHLLPADAPDLAGRHSVGVDGFTYGSSYAAVYAREALEQVRSRWGISFRAGSHSRLPGPVQSRLSEIGREFRLYDTAKALNLMLQGDGFALHHFFHPGLYHLGGISAYLSEESAAPADRSSRRRLTESEATVRRREFARWAAQMLVALLEGTEPPEPPTDPELAKAALTVAAELQRLVDDHA